MSYDMVNRMLNRVATEDDTCPIAPSAACWLIEQAGGCLGVTVGAVWVFLSALRRAGSSEHGMRCVPRMK